MRMAKKEEERDPILGQGSEFRGSSLTFSVAKMLSAKLVNGNDDI